MSANPVVIRHRQIDAPVDVHVLHFGESQRYLDECLSSLEHEPVNVWIVRGGFQGNIGAARAFAFGLGSAPYVSFVDADDALMPGAVAKCTAVMDQRPDLVGAYTDYEAISPGGLPIYRTRKGGWKPLSLLSSCWEVLHYHQYRREWITRHLDGLAQCPCYEETYLAGMLAQYGDFEKLNICGYRKREAGQSMRLQDAQLLRRIYRDITPSIMTAQRRWTETRRVA